MSILHKTVPTALALLISVGAYSQQSATQGALQAQGPQVASSAITQSFGASSVTTFCTPMDPNSTGLSTTITATMGTGVGSGLHLEAIQGPAGQYGYFRVGTAANDPGIALGQGRLCLAVGAGNVIGRYTVPGPLNSIGQFDVNGVLQNLAGTSTTGTGFDVPNTVPISGDPMIMAGDTWHFQLIHRENGGTWNYSNGLTVTF